MAKVDKIIEKWDKNTPTDESKELVFKVLKSFFKIEPKKGSHYIIIDSRLKDEALVNFLVRKKIYIKDEGKYTIPTVNGRRVKGTYLKEIVEIIKALKGFEEARRKKRRSDFEEGY